jgi:hypothetical protein
MSQVCRDFLSLNHKLNIEHMKTIKMQPTAFYQFKQKANEFKIWFDCKISKGLYEVTADKLSLEKLGY